MKILKISGKNLASLADPFTVDFEAEPLASSGLFAISGPTGAGKSTLLDALCLALYDATPRLLKVAGRGSALPDVGKETVSAQDTRTLLRRGAADGYAEVDFVGNDGAAYRARWSVRRSRNKADGLLQPTAMSLHQLPALHPVGATKTEVKLEIERRIGLSFDQFTRAVLLAQNEFATFLKTEDNERGELLETLTGSTVYSDISMRAFERAKREQTLLARLTERLADQKPLDQAERAALETEHAAAQATLAGLDARKALLDAHLRWHQEALRLAQQEQLACQAVERIDHEWRAAAPRRAALLQLEAAQGARPLAEASARIDDDSARVQTQLAAGEHAAALARAAQEQLTAALERGAALALEAEGALRAAAPLLDQAKALDARIEALRPGQLLADAARQQADQASDAAGSALRRQQDRHSQLLGAQATATTWLAQHQPWQALAQSWPRWDLLFTQAEQVAAQAGRVAQAHGASSRQLQQASGQDSAATAAMRAAAAQSGTLETQRGAAAAALAGFDGDAIERRRQALDARRGHLAAAEKCWTELDAKQLRQAQLGERQAQLRLTVDAACAALLLEQQQAAGVTAALAQAERSLQGAQAACAASVETLRASLRDEQPCPVCGALEHPYRHEDGALRAMLASLDDEVTRCRAAAERHIGRLATERAKADAARAQLAALAAEAATLSQTMTGLSADWAAHAAGLGIEAGAAAQSDWFAQHNAVARQALEAVQEQETAQRRAQAAYDVAHQAYDRAAAEHARAGMAAAAAQASLAQAQAALATLEQQRAALDVQLAALLDELDGAFRHADLAHDEWKDNWHSAPARFHAERLAESRLWLAQRAAYDERGAALATAEVELKAAGAVVAKADQDANAARNTFMSADAALRALLEQRRTLWDGRAVAEVEAGLAATLGAARAHLLAQQHAAAQAEQARIRLDEAQVQAAQRLAALREQALHAAAALSEWLLAWHEQAPEQAAHGLPALRALLAVPDHAVRAERLELQAIDARAASAATVLAERRARCRQHAEQAPARREMAQDRDLNGAPAAPDGDLHTTSATLTEHQDGPWHAAGAERVGAQLALLAAERGTAQQAVTALHLTIAQDQARREGAQAMLAEIDQQQAIEQRWARMNELIGSADGKKFRNYAQQFTLDVLLGYANAHLQQLARRYQLERIDHPASPSLGLMVRDQDMGGELRSVHSLSGGESFLVSLALALGLASLSSNRVRVESLFIDEGFGSLDSDTLRVAMDALDGLQSMGRKVGVISHVQEMTERIATRILVRPTAGGRSAVSVT
ncbi:MAG: AAA family ATPase [Pseudomonadota bacterium]